ncbi:MAG: hypothetical protein KAG92_06560, partial [Deltaproteobacteria bacterium]|nr:hypothetical protein [Deltaproteobacteria bacterium]
MTDKFNNDNQLAIPHDPNNPRNLPSTDVRELLPPDLEEEIHLRDYLDVLVRRKWVVIAILLVIFCGVAIFILNKTPLFLASSVIKATTQEAKTTSFEKLHSDNVWMQNFLQTQINLLQSEQVAGRVIKALALEKNPLFNPQAAVVTDEEDAGIMSWVKEIISMAMGFIRSQDESKKPELSSKARDFILQNQLLGKFRGSLQVSLVRNSELIKVSFESPDAKLAAEIVNVTMTEFVNMHMDSRMEAAKVAGK